METSDHNLGLVSVPSIRWVFLGVCGMLGCAAVGLWYSWVSSGGWPDRAARGDFWGGHLGPTIAAVGLLCLLATLHLQRRELTLQRQLSIQQWSDVLAQRAVMESTAALERFFVVLEAIRSLQREADDAREAIKQSSSPQAASSRLVTAEAKLAAARELAEALLNARGIDSTERKLLRTIWLDNGSNERLLIN